MERETKLQERPWLMEDPVYEVCMRLILGGLDKRRQSFGAVVQDKEGELVSVGRSMRVYKSEPWRRQGYANHAEAMALFVANLLEYDVTGVVVYVAGFLKGGNLLVRSGIESNFTCKLCSGLFVEYGVDVVLPTVFGWERMSALESVRTSAVFDKRANKVRCDGEKMFETRTLESVFVDEKLGGEIKEKVFRSNPSELLMRLDGLGFVLSPLVRESLLLTDNCYLNENDYKELILSEWVKK